MVLDRVRRERSHIIKYLLEGVLVLVSVGVGLLRNSPYTVSARIGCSMFSVGFPFWKAFELIQI